ncbi:MAG: HDOD domain-containing protein [Thiobacillus sp.]
MADWLVFLGQADIPVLKSTARELHRVRTDESLMNARSIANIVTDDPLMTVKLLRHLHARRHRSQTYELVDVKQALIMMGLNTFFHEVPDSPIAESMLGEHLDALVQLLHTVRRAQRAARLAFDWAVRLHDLHAEEVQAAALLTHVAEMLMWCFNPAQMLDIRKRQAADRSLRSEDVQKQVLGFGGLELQRQLTTEWGLSELMVSLSDEAQAESVRVRTVKLAASLARHSAQGWHDAALPDDFRRIGELLRMDEDSVRRLVGAPPP